MSCRWCCKNSKNAEHEVIRLRLNWVLIVLLPVLHAMNYSSILSSFHQYLTNPKPEDLINVTISEIEPGLGKSESFYSWVITVYNTGMLFGALGTGFIVTVIPYWYIIFSSLVLYCISFAMYGLSNSGWVIMISKLLAGLYVGMETTYVPAYIGKSFDDYEMYMKEIGKPLKSSKLKYVLMGLSTVFQSTGYLFGSLLTVVFAQFDIDQFRSVAWANVAMGILFIGLQLALFHGECTFRELQILKCSWQKVPKCSPPPSLMDTTIVIYFIIFNIARGVGFAVYETLFNPILSDSFGFSERDASYFFLGAMVANAAGAIAAVILQLLKVKNHNIALMGFAIAIAGSTLMADWQSIPYDPCTEYSLFHHPELADNYSEELNSNPTAMADHYVVTDFTMKGECFDLTHNPGNATSVDVGQIHLYTYISTNDLQRTELPHTTMNCTSTETCVRNHFSALIAVDQSDCLQLTFVIHLHPSCLKDWILQANTSSLAYVCTVENFAACVFVQDNKHLTNSIVREVHLQSLQIVDQAVYDVAMNTCESHTELNCHWIPNSEVTNKHCNDCQPICRSRDSTLSFAQFCVGVALWMFTRPISRTAVYSMILEVLDGKLQTLVIGLASSANVLGAAISPLWLDAAYEGVQKRTFLPMSIVAGLFVLTFLGGLLLYPWLGQKICVSSNTSTSEEEEEEEKEESTEMSLLVPKKLDNSNED